MQTFKRNKVNSGVTSRIRVVMRAANRTDFSDVENADTAVQSIRSIASAAVKNTARNNIRLHLPRVMVRANSIVRLNETGEAAVIATVKHNTYTIYKRGQVLHARKS